VKTQENKGESDRSHPANHVRTEGELAENLQETKSKV
jgi:hypothetical protein